MAKAGGVKMPVEGEAMAGSTRRVMLYTHNSIGLGHVFRSLAVITGMRAWAPDWDFLVMSGSSIPQTFLAEGIEVLKLPGVRRDFVDGKATLRPRHLGTLTIKQALDLRARLMAEALAGFAPDIVLVEHNMAGLGGELLPLLEQKRRRRGGARDFALAHLSRGILSAYPEADGRGEGLGHAMTPNDITGLYDFRYILEDRGVVATGPEAGRPALDGRAVCLGKIAIRNRDELPPASQAKRAWGLPDQALILFSLGRVGPVARLTRVLGQIMLESGLLPGHRLAVVVDPYLPPDERQELERCAESLGANLLGFSPRLVELINAADLLVCRAGYNTFNEALLTGTRTLFVPEGHGGMEQERRVARLAGPHQASASEAEVLAGGIEEQIQRLLKSPRDPAPPLLDRFAVGRRMVRDLEGWLRGHRAVAPGEGSSCRA